MLVTNDVIIWFYLYLHIGSQGHRCYRWVRWPLDSKTQVIILLLVFHRYAALGALKSVAPQMKCIRERIDVASHSRGKFCRANDLADCMGRFQWRMVIATGAGQINLAGGLQEDLVDILELLLELSASRLGIRYRFYSAGTCSINTTFLQRSCYSRNMKNWMGVCDPKELARASQI